MTPEESITAPTAQRTVGDLMAVEPIVVRADSSLSEAVHLMDLHHVSGLPVVNEGGEVVGVISQTDLVNARATEYLWANWTGLAVRHLMTSPPLTVTRSTSLDVATRRMERNHVHRLVVVADDDPTVPIGVISTSDLVRALAQET
ncbi:MAG: CBS domain-containing protein [Chloroflexota bacterium]|nr:CBS domain-containing protein [Chloroflexota bacterium]